MANQKEELISPVESGRFDNASIGEQLLDSDDERQREVDRFFAEHGISDEAERSTEPLQLVTYGHPIGGENNDDNFDNESQPTSAFSSSSSEEDDDADDEDDGEDEEEWDQDAEAEGDEVDETEAPPVASVPETHFLPPPPAAFGSPDGDGEYVLYRPNYYHHSVHYHDESSSSSDDVRKKKTQFRAVPLHSVVRSTPLRTISSPDSPTSPKKQQQQQGDDTEQIGLLPEPSPELETGAETADAETAQKPSSINSSYTWSEDEDDPDDGWFENAIAEVKSDSRRGSEVSVAESLPEVHQVNDTPQDDLDWPEDRVTPTQNAAEAEHGLDVENERASEESDPERGGEDDQVLSKRKEAVPRPQTPTNEGEDDKGEEEGVDEHGSLQPVSRGGPEAAVEYEQHREPFQRPQTPTNEDEGDDEEGSIAPVLQHPDEEASLYDEDGILISQDHLSQNDNDVEDVDNAPESFNPVFDGAEQVAQRPPMDRLVSLLSPNSNGPELFTGLTAEEGLDAWWEYHQQAAQHQSRMITRRNSGRENVNRTGEVEKGDFRSVSEDRAADKSDAAHYLSRQRLAAMGEATKIDSKDSDRRKLHAERLGRLRLRKQDEQHYFKLQMLKYRAQRNSFLEKWVISSNKAQEDYDRVGRRNRHIDELTREYNKVTRELEGLTKQHEEMLPVLDSFMVQHDKHEEEKDQHKRLQNELQTVKMYSDAYQQSAEQNADLARHERARRAEKFQMSDIMTVVSHAPESPSSDEVSEHVKDSPDHEMVSPIGGRTIVACKPSPLPEHHAHWPIRDRPNLVTFMTAWINNHREQDSLEESLSPKLFENILDNSKLTWDQLIDQIKELGYIIRPDHLAAALSDPENVHKFGLPQPIPAVLYAARRLRPDTAVSELMQEIDRLRKELEMFQPAETERITHDLETQIQTLQDQLTLEKSAAPKDSSEIQKQIEQFVASVKVPQEGHDELSGLQAQLDVCNKHSQELQSQVDGLNEQLRESEDACVVYEETYTELTTRLDETDAKLANVESAEQLQSQVEDLSERLTESEKTRVDWEETCTELNAKMTELEAQVAHGGADREEQMRLRGVIDELQADLHQKQKDLEAYQQYSEELQTRIDEVEAEVEQMASAEHAKAITDSGLSTPPLQAETITDDPQTRENKATSTLASAAASPLLPQFTQPKTRNFEVAARPQTYIMRENAIRKDKGFIEDQEKKRKLREQSHKAEWDRVEMIRQRLCAKRGGKAVPYVPKSQRFLGLVA